MIVFVHSELESIALIDMIFENALVSFSSETLSKAIETSEVRGFSRVMLKLKNFQLPLMEDILHQEPRDLSSTLKSRDLSTEAESLAEGGANYHAALQQSQEKPLSHKKEMRHPVLVFSEASLLKDMYDVIQRYFKW